MHVARFCRKTSAKVVSSSRAPLPWQRRYATPEAGAVSRKEGDISSVFRSLSGGSEDEPLPPRFADVKKRLVRDRDALYESWKRLLGRLEEEVDVVRAEGSACIPEIQFSDIDSPAAKFSDGIRKRGVAVVRNLVPEDEARAYKGEIEAYITANPSTKGEHYAYMVYTLLGYRCYKALLPLWEMGLRERERDREKQFVFLANRRRPENSFSASRPASLRIVLVPTATRGPKSP